MIIQKPGVYAITIFDTSVLLAAAGSSVGASRAILLTALAEQSDVLLTLDRKDFSEFLDTLDLFRIRARP